MRPNPWRKRWSVCVAGVLFDTDILIWVQRGNHAAAALIDAAGERFLSAYSLMELLQCAHDKRQQRASRSFVSELGFVVLPLSGAIGHRALIYIEEYGLSTALRAGDALVAATAAEIGLRLVSTNVKHYKAIKELDFKPFYVRS
jgi:predicted nucleic acid-binding protein